MPLNGLQKTFQCGESLASEDLNSIVQAINNTVTAVNTIKNNLEGHQYDVSVPITSIYCRTKKNINASGFFPQSDVQKVALFEEVTNCQLTQGIKYNVNFLTVTLDNIADNMNGVWTAYPQGITEELPHEWEASFKKLEDSNEVIFMFGPVLVSNYGFSGADGDGVQYVYKLFDHELTEIERTANTPVKPVSPNQNGEYIPYGWSDDPQGATSEYPYEYVATLKRIQGVWGDFEKIALWGTYSEDGINGDFQTRVFCRFNPTALKLAPNKPLGGTYDSPQPGSNDSIAWSMTVPSGDGLVWTSTRTFKGDGTVTDWSTPVIESDSNELDIEYSSSATKPSIDTLRGTPGVPHPSNNVWHDPSESGIDLSSMIWRAERKIKNKVYEGNWVITRLTGVKGSFKSIVFKRFTPTIQQSSPAAPSGGTYDNPVPSGWSDGIPGGNGPIWASTCTFTEEDTEPVSSLRWSEPKLQSDTEELDIEFSPNTTQPSNPTGEPFSNRQSQGWYDSSASNFNSVGPMIWRAERKVVNGQYEGSWTVTRIFGEQGIPGVRGDFVSRVFCRKNTKPSRPTGGSYESPYPEDNVGGVLIWSDGIPSGEGIIWSSTRLFYGDPSNPATVWSDPAQESDTTTLDIEYSNNVTEPGSETLRQNVGDPHPANSGVNWYDPVTSTLPEGLSWNDMIWRAERQIKNGEYSGAWVITKILGEQGPEGKRGQFKSFVFKRSNDVISSIAAADDNATYDSPIPNNTWSDSIPEGTATLWMAVSKFTGVGDNHTSWTVSQQSDSRDFDIEFSKSTTEPQAPTGNPFSNRSSQGWYNSNTIPPENDANNPGPIVWRAERKVYEGKFKQDDPWVITRILGERGSDAVLTSEQVQILAKAGLEIVISPQNIILDQSGILISASDDKIDNDFTVNISVYKNGTILNTNDYQINSNSVEMYGNGSQYAFSNTSNAFFEVQSKAIVIKNLPITTNNNQYTYTYNKGYIKGTIAVILEGTTYNVPFNIPWYLNKLGERESKILGDVETTYMSRDSFTNPENPLYSSYTARIQDGADGRMAQYGLIRRNAGNTGYESNVLSADYAQTAEQNLSNLKKTITGTNLLPQNNWTNVNGTIQDISNYLINYSPFIYLDPGIYIFSCYSQSNYNAQNISQTNLTLQYRSSATKPDKPSDVGEYNSATGVTHKGILEADQNSGYEGDYYTVNDVTYPRWYIKLVVTEAKYYTLCITSGMLGRKYYRPQLELCTTSDETPTPWVPGPQEFSSEIKQTAEAITSTVQGLNNSISQVQQTADNITSQVTQLQKGKNLLSGTVSGKHWKSTTPTGQAHTIEGIDSDGFITAKSGDSLLRHPDITIKKNTYYTLSLYSKNTSAFNFLINSPNSDFTEFSVEVPSGTQSTRRSISFKVEMEGTGTVSIRPIFQTTTIQYPQIEIGSTATEFETSFAEIGSKITQAIDSIDLSVTGVTATQLATAGIHLSAGNGDPGTITLNAENFSLVDSSNNLVFGKESGSSNLTFSGDIKNGTSGDGFDGAYTNEIRADGTGNLGGRLIEWDPDYGLYIGPGPSSGYENYDVMSDTYKPSGDDYNGDGIRVFPNGRIHFQGQMDGNFKFGKIGMEGNSGRISIYGEGVDSTHREHNILLSKYGLTIRPQVFTSSEDILENGAQSAYNKTDAGAISFGSTPNVGASNAINWNNPNVPANQSIVGDTGSTKKYNQRIYIKGCDGFIYQGYTGVSNNLCFINGICIGPSSGFNNSSDYMNMNTLFPS